MTLRPRHARTQRSREGSVGSCGVLWGRWSNYTTTSQSCRALWWRNLQLPKSGTDRGEDEGVFCCTANVIDLRARHLFCLNVLNEFLSADE